MTDWINWTSVIANIATSVGILAFVGIYLSHQHNQKQFKFTVMLSCIDRFQNLFPIIRNDVDDDNRINRYIDLTNEEFFYFQRGYIPKEVMVEWMDSIIEYQPIYANGQDLPINHLRLSMKQIHTNSMLEGYPRLQKALHVKKEYDVNIIYERKNDAYRKGRKELITEIVGNLDISVKNKHFKSALLT